MKINKSSWHYWLHKEFASDSYHCLRNGYNVSLCTYFWSTLWQLVKGLALIVICLALAAVGLLFLYMVFNLLAFIITGVLFDPVSWVDSELALGLVMLIVMVASIVGFIATVTGELKVFPDYLKKPVGKLSNTLSATVKDKSPSLLKQYYKAWKSKVCPFIKLE